MNASIRTETLQQFYQRTNQDVDAELRKGRHLSGHFNVKSCTSIARKTPYNRRDYFKVCLTDCNPENSGVFRYGNQNIVLDSPCLIFTNPSVPASIESHCTYIDRHYCLFNHQFIEGAIRPDIQYSCALFNPTLHPVIKLSKEERAQLSIYFLQMQSLMRGEYALKWEMIRHVLLLLIHEGISLQQKSRTQPALNDRVVNGFFNLLNQQFPVVSAEQSLTLLTPSHFAQQLHVHVNHLNSVVKKHTGKSTTSIIHERVIAEAKSLLHNTDWNVSEIAYALGFQYPSHFNKYFKQFTSLAPLEFRSAKTPNLALHL